ncbi:MAG: type II toxin-antitoxin system RelE/ParE family toxin [Opitutae bacterium]|nr:type II toxin-antitoxin system RelE/ParE family toxin [Opitutae bacterium]
MTRLLLVRPEAEQELAAASRWYEGKRARLGDEFLDDAAAAMRVLAQDPERERLYYRSFRRVLLRRFPYKIFYQVIGDRVVVFRVLHAKQEHTRGLKSD